MKIIILFLFFALLWAFGLFYFVSIIPKQPVDNFPKTDAVVVLTGGTNRIAHGMKLVANGAAPMLLVSGVNDVQSRRRFVENYAEDSSITEAILRPGVLHLDDKARDTYANATETSKWLLEHPVDSIRLVTSDYHMPRSLLVFDGIVPSNIRIYPDPVSSGLFTVDDWWQSQLGLRVIIAEYHKYLVVRLAHMVR